MNADYQKIPNWEKITNRLNSLQKFDGNETIDEKYIEQTLNKFNINLKDANGQIKDNFIILFEVILIWRDLTRLEKEELALALFGLENQPILIEIIDMLVG